MTVRYGFDPGQSQFTARAFAAGLLSFVGHSPTFAVPDFRGALILEDDDRTFRSIELTVAPDSLALVDRVSPSDRQEIESRMRRDVLETAAHREIVFEAADLVADPIAQGRQRLRIAGRLTLRGVTRPQSLTAELQRHEDALRLLGEGRILQSDFGIRPVTALGGTITLKDEVKLAFDLIAIKEPGQP